LRAIEIVGEPQVAGAVQGQAKWIARAGRLNDYSTVLLQPQFVLQPRHDVT
jgi:hypothetical protein